MTRAHVTALTLALILMLAALSINLYRLAAAS